MTQLQAIIGSCLKWWRYRFEKGCGVIICPLCKKYKGNCEECPVGIKAGTDGCDNTPYMEWSECDEGEDNKYALKELQFLFDLIKPRYYRNVEKELNKGDYPKKFRAWMLRAIAKKEA